MVDRAGTTRPMDLGLADEWGEWCRNPELGLYVAPASNGREWHGLHFISSGAFAGAVFAFAITIPAGCVGACSAHFRQPPGDADSAWRIRRDRYRFHLRTLKLAWYAYAKDNAALGALIFLLVIVLVSLLAPLISPYDPADAVASIAALPGTEGVLLGADVDGRDILSRLFWGGRIALLVGIGPTVAATLISLFLGLTAGYFGGWFDQILMRIVDVVFAFPLVLLAIVIAGVLEPGVWTVILAISIALTPYIARLVRTTTLNVKQQPYVEAARAGGAGGRCSRAGRGLRRRHGP